MAFRTALLCVLVVVFGPPAFAQIDFFHGDIHDAFSTVCYAATGDFNSDGNRDVIVAPSNSIDYLSIFLGDGAGGFTRTEMNVGDGEKSLVVGYFNRDAYLDLVVTLKNTISLFQGMGDGTFVHFFDYDLARVNHGLVAEDFNEDGNLDVAFASYDSLGSIFVLLGTGLGTFSGHISNWTEGDYGEGIAVGDLNEDSHLDVAFSGYGGADVYLGNGTGYFERKTTGLAHDAQLAIYDIDHDSHLDVVQGGKRGGVGAYYGDGTGSFPAYASAPTDGWIISLAVCDLDEDSYTDIVVGEKTNGTIAVVRGLPNRELVHIPWQRSSRGTNPHVIIPWQIDGDDHLDLMVGVGGLSEMLNGSFNLSGCRMGTVDMLMGACQDVLFVNGMSGSDAQRRVVINQNDPLTVIMSAPPGVGGGEAVFALYGWIDFPDDSTVRPVRFGIGTACMPIPISRPFNIRPNGYWNNTGGWQLDVPSKTARDSIPAPSIVEYQPQGVGEPASGFLQGVIYDPHSTAEHMASMTNGIEVIIQ